MSKLSKRLVCHSSMLAVATGLALLSVVGAAVGATTPNVILAMADDMGWGDPGYNGNPVIRTPNLDSMSSAGLRFDRFYAPTVCSPTRGSCMTGRHPYRYGVFSANVGHLPPDERTIAEALKTRGYVTGHFCKWHLGTQAESMHAALKPWRESRRQSLAGNDYR